MADGCRCSLIPQRPKPGFRHRKYLTVTVLSINKIIGWRFRTSRNLALNYNTFKLESIKLNIFFSERYVYTQKLTLKVEVVLHIKMQKNHNVFLVTVISSLNERLTEYILNWFPCCFLTAVRSLIRCNIAFSSFVIDLVALYISVNLYSTLLCVAFSVY